MAYQSLETKIGSILLKIAGLNKKDLEDVLLAQKDSHKKIGDILIERNLLQPSDISKALAFQLGLPYIDDLQSDDIDPIIVKDISIQYCREHKIMPIAVDDESVKVAMVDPFNYEPIDALRMLYNKEVELVISSPLKVDEAINRVFERSENLMRELEVSAEDYDDDFSLESSTLDLLEAGDDAAPVIRFVRTLLSRAVKEKASDIHIEPYEHRVAVRFRVDGIMYDVHEAPKALSAAIASGIKIMADLNIAEKRIPQDGRFKIKVGNREIDIRLSVVPVQSGERIVMRLLDKSSVSLELDELGFDESDINLIDKLTNKKHGIFLVTGPTGSGKSTTLAACLKNISSPERNVITVEDPIEHQLNGVSQIAVNHKVGLSFAAGLRSILRQDPDVVMVGEIRDTETAEIAINASLTGHFVLSTIHTNDAAGAITRLIDMGIEPFLVSSSTAGVLAQRLIRVVCSECAEDYEPDFKTLEKAGISIEELQEIHNSDKIVLKKAKGCSECRNTGYQKRSTICEILSITDSVRQLILDKEDAAIIKKAAVKEGMQTLRLSAIKKMLAGETTLEEVSRATHEEE